MGTLMKWPWYRNHGWIHQGYHQGGVYDLFFPYLPQLLPPSLLILACSKSRQGWQVRHLWVRQGQLEASGRLLWLPRPRVVGIKILTLLNIGIGHPPLNGHLKSCKWEHHWTKWRIFQHIVFDYSKAIDGLVRSFLFCGTTKTVFVRRLHEIRRIWMSKITQTGACSHHKSIFCTHHLQGAKRSKSVASPDKWDLLKIPPAFVQPAWKFWKHNLQEPRNPWFSSNHVVSFPPDLWFQPSWDMGVSNLWSISSKSFNGKLMIKSRILRPFWGTRLPNNHICHMPHPSPSILIPWVGPGCWIFTATALPTSKAKVTRVPDVSVAARRTRPVRPSKAKLPLTSPSPSKVVLWDARWQHFHGFPSTCAACMMNDECTSLWKTQRLWPIPKSDCGLMLFVCVWTPKSVKRQVLAPLRIAKEIINDTCNGSMLQPYAVHNVFDMIYPTCTLWRTII